MEGRRWRHTNGGGWLEVYAMAKLEGVDLPKGTMGRGAIDGLGTGRVSKWRSASSQTSERGTLQELWDINPLKISLDAKSTKNVICPYWL